MLILKLFRFLFGYVSFTASGGFPERFINLCKLNRITLWELKCENSVISACTDCPSYKRIRSAAKKSGMRVRLSRKHGLPFFIERHSRRIGVLIGACLCVCIITVLSTRIWSIDVTGNSAVPSEKIAEVFEQLGVKVGVAGSRIDIRSTEIAALQRLPELSWLNINIAGSAARIEVRERKPETKIDADSKPTDIVAARDGQIVILRSFSGTPAQKIGSAVLKGNLLISGAKENKDLTVRFCHASGYVVARTARSTAVSQSSTLSVKKIADEKKSFILDFLIFSVPIGKTGESAYRNKSMLYINGVTLPVGITECSETVYEDSEAKLSEERTKALALLRFFDKCAADFRYLKLEKTDISCNSSDKGCIVSGEFTCLENIGEERAMQIEQE